MTVIVRKVSERLKKAQENAKLHRDHLIRKIREEEKEKCVKVLRKTEFGDIYSKIKLPQPEE